jgi:hypothetical protein
MFRILQLSALKCIVMKLNAVNCRDLNGAVWSVGANGTAEECGLLKEFEDNCCISQKIASFNGFKAWQLHLNY